MRQQSIIHSEKINRKGELKYFQISLPGTAKKIIAIESGIVLLSAISENSVAPVIFTPETPPATGGSGGSENCPNPGTANIDPVSNDVAGSVRTQVFRIGASVNPGFIYSCGVYSVVISVTAVTGDTPSSIAEKMAAAVNDTTLATWNQYGSNNQNYKPTGSSNGDLLTLTTDNQHSFFASGSGSCTGEPLPPQAPAYDPLFFIARNDKAGTLTLQSPDKTDIFFQGEVFRDDNNIGFADFTNKVLVISEWTKGKARFANEVLIDTNTPIIEGYYKDIFGLLRNQDIQYELRINIWIERNKQ